MYKELEAKGIQTFKDDKELVCGCLIAPELVQAIKGSRIAIVVVSATYPASLWCHEELVKILKLEKEGFLTLVPIFYEVDPCQVRRQTREVVKQFKKHEKRNSKERVKSWRNVLKRLTILSGEYSRGVKIS
ncbi:hypothetical protein N665_0567s0008 [Sinapis alba]|nr:hypothetical protein N665_0567s0008 [Sinapis alba]